MASGTITMPDTVDPADAAGPEALRTLKTAALRTFRAQNGINAYTSPRALRRFIGSQLPELPNDVGCGSSNHQLVLVTPQSYERKDTGICFVSSVCTQCRYHFHVKNDTRHSRTFDKEHPKHMLIACEQKTKDDLRRERTGYNEIIGYTRFICTADDCLSTVEVFLMPPKLSNDEVDMFKDPNRVLRNLQRARADDPDRYNDVGDGYGADPALTILKYLTDALLRPHGSGPLRIKKRNKRFRVSFAEDFDPLLRQLGFQDREEEGEACWFITEPEEAQTPTPVRTLRARMQDTQEELKLLVEGQKTTPAWDPLLRAFQGDYNSIGADPVAYQQTKEPDLALLGCLIDYQPHLFSWAAILLAKICPRRRDEFLDAGLRCIQQRSEEASFDITVFRSQFDPSTSVDITVQIAYKFFDSSPNDGNSSDWILSKYYLITEADPSDDEKALALHHLEVISNNIGRDLVALVTKGSFGTAVRPITQGSVDQPLTQGSFNNPLEEVPVQPAFNRKMSIRSATKLLDIDANYSAEIIQDFAGNVGEKVDRVKVVEALEVLGDLKKQQNLAEEAAKLQETADFLRATGNVAKGEMAIPSLVNQQPFSADPASSMNAPPGLRNIGNTCYLNSLLQYFYNVKAVRDVVLNFDQIQLELDEDIVSKRRTGGNGTSVNIEEAIVARQFIEELRKLFSDLQSTTDSAAQPSQKLANTALSSAKEILSESADNQPPPLPARPSPAPPVPPKEDVDMVNVTIEPINDQVETASSRSSHTLVNEGEETRLESLVQMTQNDDKGTDNEVVDGLSSSQAQINASNPLHSGEDVEMKDSPEVATLEEKMAQVSRRLEQSDRSGTSQQDVEEIIGNILEHLMRAIRPDSPMPGKPDLQTDKITEIFFTMIVNCTVKTSPGPSVSTMDSAVEENILNEEIVPERWITAFPHPDKANKVKSTLYAALDRYFSYELLADGSIARYTTIRALPPIVHICIQRSDASGVKNKNPVVIPEVLYLDRYMETETGSYLWNTRRRVWALKERLQVLESRSMNTCENIFKETQVDRRAPNEVSDPRTVHAEPGDIFKLDEGLMKDIGRPRKRKVFDASPNDSYQSIPSKRQSLSPEPHNSTTKFVDTLWESSQSLDVADAVEISQLRKGEDEAFTSMQQEKYSLHAVICHGGGMNAGHYWVWVRDFKKNVWYKYNDSLVTEDSRDSQSVLDELNNSGDPYYVAYVRDEIKDDLVEVPQRQQQENGEAHSGDLDMQTIEGIVPPSSPTTMVPSSQTAYATSEKADDGLPPYEML
ncbi:Uu.00g142720.m01.CDS01 [Anthostomella pinea]|uniref:ubiquitinyl hydrolase 1 n=1 Tax=Anthostomella pinea TaxID=933095 RepID=A0AAI8VQM4_9PEZI|nr:Uu.00g142720.m01.CDS01 [Anthostomella pinea]